MLLTVFTESLKLPLSWNPDKESHLLCLQLLLLLPSSGAASTSPSPQSGRLCLSTVPHTCGTSCPCDACAGPYAPSRQTLAHTLCWACRKCRPGAGREQRTRYTVGVQLRKAGASRFSREKSPFGDNTLEAVEGILWDQMPTWKSLQGASTSKWKRGACWLCDRRDLRGGAGRSRRLQQAQRKICRAVQDTAAVLAN